MIARRVSRLAASGALIVLLIAGCQNARSARLRTPTITPNVAASLMVVQQTQNAARTQRAQVAALTPEPGGVQTYCETAFLGTRTPDECRAWVNRVMEVYPADVAYCQNAGGDDFGACLTDRQVPLPE